MTLRHAALPRASIEVMPAVTQSPAARQVMDEAAFQVFYQRTAPGLRSYIHRSGGSADLADDILQDAFLRFLRAAPGDLEPSQQRAYLYKIASSLLVDYWRRLNREQRWAWNAFLGKQTATDAKLDLGHDLSAVFQTLKPQQRSLLWLAYVEGFDLPRCSGCGRTASKYCCFGRDERWPKCSGRRASARRNRPRR